MRDGVKLVTDVFRDDTLTQAPVVLMRTPYDRTSQKGLGEYWVKAGYVFVAQDCRGTRASAGVLAPYNNEGQDGYDTIEWLTRQTWCNGRVGMVGGSYVGAVQWQAAVEHPQGLVVIAPQATWSSFYRNLYLGRTVFGRDSTSPRSYRNCNFRHCMWSVTTTFSRANRSTTLW